VLLPVLLDGYCSVALNLTLVDGLIRRIAFDEGNHR
jgi:hypothetical protein